MLQDEIASTLDAMPDKRREDREPVGGLVLVANKTYPLVDWSSSGFLAKGYGDGLNKGERHPIEFTVFIDDESYHFECSAIIVRTDPEEGLLAGAFVLMAEDDRLAVARYFA